MRTSKRGLLILAITGLMTYGDATVAQDQATVVESEDSTSTLRRVEAQYVCMPNNKYLQKEQTPVRIEGKTYYACCQMCEKVLHMDPKTRMAVDPMSGESVDKARAVIGALPNGKVYYFENEENMRNFKVKPHLER